MSQRRSARVADLIRQEISSIIQNEVKDPGIGFITITSVDISLDLRHAKIYFSRLGSKDEVEQSLNSLERATGFIRSSLGRKIRLRHIPELLFRYDESFDYAQRITNVINHIDEVDPHELKSDDGNPVTEEDKKPR